MATRREDRKDVKLSVRIFGIDASGQIFSDQVTTVNVSLRGAMLSGIRRQIKPGEVIGLTYGRAKARFRVQWVGQRGTQQQDRIGIQNVVPRNCLWELALPEGALAKADKTFTTPPRQHPRIKCTNSVELRPVGQPPVWSKVGDVSEAGCFVEMMMPLQAGTRLRISLWLNDDKVAAQGVVVHGRPGFGVGIRFTEMCRSDAERLREFLKSVVRLPIHS